MSSIILLTGCKLPLFIFVLGNVMSIFSASSFLFNSSILNFSSFSSINFSRLSFASFTSPPITGLSSGLSPPIPLNTAVNSPFFPRYFTLAFSNVCKSSAFAISSIAVCLILSICSFIFFSFQFIHLLIWSIKNPFLPVIGRNGFPWYHLNLLVFLFLTNLIIVLTVQPLLSTLLFKRRPKK